MGIGTVEGLFIADAAGQSMRPIAEVEALAQAGLANDRYASGRGYWPLATACQVTLIAAEDLEEITETFGVDALRGEHRRNIVTRGVRLETLWGRRFRVGDAVFAYERPRPPCTYLAALTQPAMLKALWTRGGIGARVAVAGRIAVGDAISVLGGEAVSTQANG